MAGSLRNFQYETDAGDIFLYTADESNTEAVNGVSADIAPGNENNYGIPKNVRPRRVFYADPLGNRVISTVVSTQVIYQTPPTTIVDPIDGGTLTLVRKTPERVRLYPNIDTGLTDGDNP